jgi:hypothetical protein
MRAIRRLSVLAAVAVLSLPFGLNSAQATNAPAHAPKVAAPLPGAYISPWGDARVEISDETLQWMNQEGITLEAISPFTMDADGRGFSMPIGSTAGDGLDTKGRIFYPGGLRFHHQSTGKTVTLKPTYITVMPRPGWSSGVEVDGRALDDELPLADTRYDEVMASARPSFTGFRLERAPFYVTDEAADLFAEQTGRSGPRVGSLFGTLTPNFDYVPSRPSLMGLPSF